MIHVRLTSRAYNDLTSITSYLTEHAPEAAPAVMLRIEQTLDHISRFPHLGRAGRRANTREVVVPQLPFLIAYRIAGDVVEVLTIFHTAQDPEQI